MNVKCHKFCVIVLMLFLFQVCDLGVINSTHLQFYSDGTPVATVCQLAKKTEGFCIPIKNCLTLMVMSNNSFLMSRRCGPINENIKNPYVCCEKHYINIERRLSTTEPPLILEEDLPRPQGPYSSAPEQKRPIGPSSGNLPHRPELGPPGPPTTEPPLILETDPPRRQRPYHSPSGESGPPGPPSGNPYPHRPELGPPGPPLSTPYPNRPTGPPGPTLDIPNYEQSDNRKQTGPYDDVKPHSPQNISEDHLSVENCGTQTLDSRIYGGLPTTQKEFPWLGRILRRDYQGELIFSCTSALISSRVVLTTAHCLISPSVIRIGEIYAVSLGEHETECSIDASECLLNKKTAVVSSYIAHPKYNVTSRNHDNDIGLIILRDKIKFTDYIKPICLLQNEVETSQFYIAGWGKTETGQVSGVKLKITIPIYVWDQCYEKYNTIKVKLTSRQICAGGEKGVDSCQGDSGGPLMTMRQDNLRWYVAGVVSFGIGCGREGWPAIYAYVPKYVDWIKRTIRERVH